MNKQLIRLLLTKWTMLINDSATQLIYHKQCEIAKKRRVQPPEKPISTLFDSIKCISIIRNKIEENCQELRGKLNPYDDSIQLDFESLFEIYSEYNLLQINKIKKCINLM